MPAALEQAPAPAESGLPGDENICRVVDRYDAAAVRAEALGRPLDLATRAARIAVALGRLYLDLAREGRGEMLLADPRRVKEQAAKLKAVLVSLGPTFVKVGQNLSNRPDLVRVDFMEELTTLQDKVPPFDSAVARRIVEEDMGRPIPDVFSSFSEEPVAAASISQVYKGVLRAGGRVVAVKVQRLGIRPVVALDLFLLRYVFETFFDEYFKRNLGCTAAVIIDEFGEKMLEELDFRQEALNIRDFHRNFADDPRVLVPNALPELCGPRCIVMDWIDGLRCTDARAFDDEEAKQAFIKLGVEAGLKQLLEIGLFHGDPHPGNVMATRDGDIGYVDFGNVAELSQYNQECLIDAVVHAMNAEYELLAGDLKKLGFLAEAGDVEPIAKDLRAVWGSSLSQQGMANFSFKNLTGQFNKLLFKYPIRVPERFSLVIRALLTQEGICLTLDRDFKLLDVAFPYVARRLLTDSNPTLRIRLLQVVIVEGKFRWDRLRHLLDLAQSDQKPGQAGMLAKLDLLAMTKDGLRILARDKGFRDKLFGGLQQESIGRNLFEGMRLGCLFTGIALRTWLLRLRAFGWGVGKGLLRPFLAGAPRREPAARLQESPVAAPSR